MSPRALKNQPKQKCGRAITLPAPPPPQSLDIILSSSQIELTLMFLSLFNTCGKTGMTIFSNRSLWKLTSRTISTLVNSGRTMISALWKDLFLYRRSLDKKGGIAYSKDHSDLSVCNKPLTHAPRARYRNVSAQGPMWQGIQNFTPCVVRWRINTVTLKIVEFTRSTEMTPSKTSKILRLRINVKL